MANAGSGTYPSPSDSNTGQGDASRVPLNVIIPIGGVGSRFARHGYRYPKPLINVVGRPMLLWLLESLSLKAGDALWIAVNEDVDDEFHVSQLVSKNVVAIDHHIVRLRHQTKGASETLYIVCQSMTETYLDRRTVSLDCDTIYWNDILTDVRAMPVGHGGCFYFTDNGDKPIFSYIKTEARYHESIVDIQEKKDISDKANLGAYVFRNARELKTHAAEALDAKTADGHDLGEYYTSQLIGHMLQSGIPYIGLHIDRQDICCVGTPEQLQTFLQSLKKHNGSGRPLSFKSRRFCFDLDLTLVGVPAVPGDYSTCPPIEKNIRLIQELHRAGHYIIIYAARRMKTHNGNVGRVVADIGSITYAQLDRYEIPFHEIHFGKPYADVYIDDLAVNANLDTAREIGWLLDDEEFVGLDAPVGSSKENKKAGMIAARDFNVIQIINNKVIKSSKSEKIMGEIYFYSQMPSEIAHIFPSIYSVDFIPETSTYTITMENCRGLTFSHILVGRSITKGRFLSFLSALHSIHTTKRTDRLSLSIPPTMQKQMEKMPCDHHGHQANIYSNYGSKLRSRYVQNRERYDALGAQAAALYERLHEFLDTYEAEDKGAYAEIVHGDPVFSNAILSKDDKSITFIDVRGQLGSIFTLEGDINYDLAKVLQSL
ncbi:capsule biosynthesis phosphatase [Drechmeria coniospora]|uniref:Mannose-1-phosphate guanyltransferase n=1 Tax=Drechmeria coniospora TaxID=98403 RepID=A0A151GYE5_DRECN|nr:capsule biosynthesis phosphatase [Drechmeria coniospora]KYK62110.1 capsule biosynthesis phosphatase [Drechmeria coniospora]